MYIAKLGYGGVCLFFLFLLQNIACGYPQSLCFEQKQEKYQNFSVENFQFLELKKSLFIAWASFRNGDFSYGHSDLIHVCLSRLMGKPTICLDENKGADQLRGNREADQRLCFRYSDSTIPLLLKSQISSF